MRNKIFFALILFLLLIVRTSLAQNVSGRVFENGSTYGVANVQVTGVSKFALRIVADATNTAPSVGENYIGITSADAGGSIPKLTVTYTLAAASTDSGEGVIFQLF